MKNKKFAVTLKTLMCIRELSVKDLAEIVGCAPITINSWRQGNVPQSIEIQKKLAKALDVPQEFLINSLLDKGKEHDSAKLHFDFGLKKISIQNYFSQILSRAETCEGGLDHLYIELLRHFPENFYENIAISQKKMSNKKD